MCVVRCYSLLCFTFDLLTSECPLWLQHEKYSSQLQMSLKVSDGHKAELEEQTRGEKLSSTKTGQQGAHAIHTVNYCQELERR